MPLRTEATFLRERAQRLRDIAALAPSSGLNAQLVDMATDLEQRADALERDQALIEAGVMKDPFSTVGEPPRVSRRLQLLRGWSHEEASSPIFR
jgi:hypothetical protein